jgi:hypothetical protein
VNSSGSENTAKGAGGSGGANKVPNASGRPLKAGPVRTRAAACAGGSFAE